MRQQNARLGSHHAMAIRTHDGECAAAMSLPTCCQSACLAPAPKRRTKYTCQPFLCASSACTPADSPVPPIRGEMINDAFAAHAREAPDAALQACQANVPAPASAASSPVAPLRRQPSRIQAESPTSVTTIGVPHAMASPTTLGRLRHADIGGNVKAELMLAISPRSPNRCTRARMDVESLPLPRDWPRTPAPRAPRCTSG